MSNYDKIRIARKLYYSSSFGVLSTISRESGLEGFPFGSLTPYCIDRDLRLTIWCGGSKKTSP